MHLLSRTVHVCYFSILIRLMNGYLLFAANLEDFHAIAKKIVPEHFADSLARAASLSPLRENVDRSDVGNSEDVTSDSDSDSLPPIKGMKENHNTKERFDLNEGTKVNFDELVERVKKRLSFDLKQNFLGNIRKESSASVNKKIKQNNDKKIEVNNYYNKYNRNVHNVAINNKKNNLKKSENQYNIRETSNFADESTYTEENVATNNKKQIIKSARDDKEQSYIEEMPPLANEPNYREDLFNKPKVKKETQNEQFDNEEEFEDSSPNVKKNLHSVKNQKDTKTDSFYEKQFMTQKDSYEDYVTPEKEANVYASSEINQRHNIDEQKQMYVPKHNSYKMETYYRPKLSKNFNNHPATVQTKIISNNNNGNIGPDKSIISPNNDEYTEKVESEEVKAITGNLWYDNDEKVTVDTIILPTSNSKHGTRLPTRHTYKVATPNYISNLPVVVEKYNFNEPIPEKDREREALKYIGNPPASINKKVRLL